MRNAETALELLGKIGACVIRVVELVFVLDVHGAAIAGFGQHGENALPIDRSLAGQPEAPPAGIIERLNSGAMYHGPQNLGVLKMEVVNLPDEVAGGLHRVDNCQARWEGSN